MKTFPRLVPKIEDASWNGSIISSLRSNLSPTKLLLLVWSLSGNDPFQFFKNWEIWQRDDQRNDTDWLIWLLLGGRGCGKTRTGAEWVRRKVFETGRIALVAPTLADAREVMLDGESGLLNIGYPMERPSYSPSRRRLDWPNGAVGYLFSAEDPDSLRGPQFGAAWADEFCAWSYPEDTLSNLRFGLRVGTHPQLVITTTPKPIPALKSLMSASGLAVSRAKTGANSANLSPAFLSAMEDSYGGTRLGRQELDGEVLFDREGALWSQGIFETCRFNGAIPQLDKIIVAIDPPVTSGKRSDQCGLIVAGALGEGSTARAFVLHDGTVQGLSPTDWAKAAISLYHGWGADALLAEVNQGGEMVKTILRTIDPNIPIKTVFAHKSKAGRAEPVALLYEQGRVFHAGRFDALEAELRQMGTKGRQKSPDRADALVWALTHLLIHGRSDPIIRQT